MMDPRECNKCRKGFCKSCINEYIDQLIAGEYAICCPNCSSRSFKLVDPHPLLQKQLSIIEAQCENSDKGCTEILSYKDIERHMKQCQYATLKCTNFGCEAEMFQKEFETHSQSCEFRTIRCDKCDVVKVKGEDHDCVKSMSAKYEHLEGKLIAVS